MKKTLTKLNYTPYLYDDTGTHTVRISDTAKSIVIVGNKEGIDNKIKEQLVEVNNIGKNVEELGPYCFYDCKKLTSFNNTQNVIRFGNYCFANSNISSIETFDTGKLVYSIGEKAFYNTQLTSVNIALTADSIKDKDDEENGYQGCVYRPYEDGAYIGNNAFENCTKLQRVTISEHPEIGPEMFKNCTALSSVNITTNYGACVGDNAFENCTALSSITFPENWEILSKQMFKDCKSLTAVNFSNSNNAKLYDICEAAFDGCNKLSTLTLPKSIIGLEQLNENAFAGSVLTSITFSGINSTEFDAYKTQDAKTTVMPLDTTTTSNYKYGIWYENHIIHALQFAWKNYIPIHFFRCNPGCSFCVNFKKYTFDTKKYKEWCAAQPYMFLYINCGCREGDPLKMTDTEDRFNQYLLYGTYDWDKKGKSGKWNGNCSFLINTKPGDKKINKDGMIPLPYKEGVYTGYPTMGALWHKPDGTVVCSRWSGRYKVKTEEGIDDIAKRLTKLFSGYKAEDKFRGSNYIPEQYVPFNGWGLKHNCRLKSADNVTYTFNYASNIIEKNTSS